MRFFQKRSYKNQTDTAKSGDYPLQKGSKRKKCPGYQIG